MKYVTVYLKDSDEIIASFEENENGVIVGITREDVEVLVDGEVLESSVKKD